MALESSNYFIYLIFITLHLNFVNCAFPKLYLQTLLSQHYLKGYDLMVSIQKESEESLVSWLRDGDNSHYSLTVADTNLSDSLESLMNRSDSLEQIAVIIEFRNISHLENEMKMAREYSRLTSVPQPVYFLIAPTAAAYKEMLTRKKRLETLSLQFSISSDFYIFGENDQVTKRKRTENKTELNSDYNSLTNIALPSQEFEGHPLPDGFAMSELYSLKNQTFLQNVDLGETSILQKVLRRADFKRAPVVTLSQVEYDAVNTSVRSEFEVDQINYLATSYNFTIIPKEGNGWIRKASGDKLIGMGEQLLNREADISISPSEMLQYRAEQLSFLHPTYFTTIWGFFKQPASNSLRDIFINAFTLDLWLTMFATWFLIVMAMFALAIVKWRMGTLHENDKVVVQEVFIWAAGAICQQGWHVCPESGCMKIVFIFALITGLVSYVGYSAALVSILSVKVIPIQSLSDLVTYRYTIYQDNHTIGTNDITRFLGSEMKLLPFDERSIDSAEALDKILKTQSAFLGVSNYFYPAARRALCSDLKVCRNIQRVSVSRGRPVQCGMFLRKRSSFTDFFNHQILLMYERGLRHRLMNNFFRQNSVTCLDLNASEKEPLGFNDVVTAYVILLIGYLLSLCVFVMEKLCHNGLAKHSGDLVTFSWASQMYYEN